LTEIKLLRMDVNCGRIFGENIIKNNKIKNNYVQEIQQNKLKNYFSLFKS
jgi:hypothetical protein